MRFYTSYVNRRGKTYSAGMSAGGTAHTRGWDAGVKVIPEIGRGNVDQFQVYMSSGSHGTRGDVLLGTVQDSPDGPQFFPAPSVAAQVLADNGVGAA